MCKYEEYIEKDLLNIETNINSDNIGEEVSNEHYKVNTVEITSKMAYLLGISKDIFYNEANPFKTDIYEELDTQPSAKIIRALSKIRFTIIRNFDKVDSAMKYDLKNLNSLPEYFDNDDIRYLSKNGIELVKVNYKATSYIIDINKYITENINKCKDLFPI